MLDYNDLKMKIASFVTDKNEGTAEEETLTPCKHIFWIKSWIKSF